MATTRAIAGAPATTAPIHPGVRRALAPACQVAGHSDQRKLRSTRVRRRCGRRHIGDGRLAAAAWLDLGPVHLRVSLRLGTKGRVWSQQLARECDAGVDAEPAVDALDVLPGRVVAQAQPLGDLAVGDRSTTSVAPSLSRGVSIASRERLNAPLGVAYRPVAPGGLLPRDSLATGASATGLDHIEAMVRLARKRAPRVSDSLDEEQARVLAAARLPQLAPGSHQRSRLRSEKMPIFRTRHRRSASDPRHLSA